MGNKNFCLCLNFIHPKKCMARLIIKHPVMCMAELINDRYCNAANRFIRLPKSDKSQEKVQMIILNPAKVDGIRVSKFVNLVAFQFSKFPW